MRDGLLILVLSFLVGWWSTSSTKSQLVRLLDVFIYGPFLIYVGWQMQKRGDKLIGLILIAMGGSTLAYNLRNYLVQQHLPGD